MPRAHRRPLVALGVVAGLLSLTACSASSDPVARGIPSSGAGASPSSPMAATSGSVPATTPATPAPSATPASATQPGGIPSSVGNQAQLDDDLRAAAWVNDVPRARALIAQGANVNAKDSTVQSAYLIATSEGYLELLDLTLAHGGTVDDKDSWNGTGLIRAAERGHHLVVGRLLQAGIDRDHVNRIGYQAIHEAVTFGRDTTTYHATVRVLAAGGVELTRPSGQQGLTPRQMAVQRELRTALATLDRVVAAPRPTDPTAALLAAADSGDADGVAIALRAGAPVDARDGSGRSARQLAAAGGHAAAEQVLIALGAR